MNSVLLLDIHDKLEDGWTPEQISGRTKEEGCYNISFKTIYSAIKGGLLLEDTVRLLPRKGKESPMVLRRQEELSLTRK